MDQTGHVRPSLVRAVLVAALWFAGHARSQAQIIDNYFPSGVAGFGDAPGVTVLTRLRPDLDPGGIDLDGFTIRPNLSQGFAFDSNVLGLPQQKGSAFVSTSGGVQATSNWGRDALAAVATFDNSAYIQQSNQSRFNDTLSLGGRYDVGAQDHLDVGLSHLDLHEDRTGLDVIASDKPVAYQVNDFRLSYFYVPSRLSFQPNVDVSTYDYASTTLGGVAVSNRYLDRTQLQYGVISRYELAPLRQVVLDVHGNNLIFSSPQIGQPKRDSSGGSVLFGIDYVASGVWRYRLLGGYQVRQFVSSAYKTHSAPILEADAVWAPTGLTTLEFTASRRIEAATDEEVVGFTYTQAHLRVEHEYLRNVLLVAGAGIERADFLQGGGQQTLLTGQAEVDWFLNRNLKVVGAYNFSDSQSQRQNSYRRHVVELRTQLAF